MKLLYCGAADKIRLFEKYVLENVCGDYIYDYPPRQAYKPLRRNVAIEKIKQSLAVDEEINLYYHFPFCKQICSYCNLFAVCESRETVFAEYFQALKKETLFYLPYIRGKRVNTLYLGGGTPSLIPVSMFEDFFAFLEREIGFCVADVTEVAMETSPDTATAEYLSALRKVGVNRVNIGVQAVADGELTCIGRKYDKNLVYDSLENVMNAGFKNVCVDLIYGLEEQSFSSWKKSVEEVVSYAPPTVCAYPLTLRGNTGFDRRGYRFLDGKEQYEKYAYARDYLLSQGYEQETHVRYKKVGSNGGYVQKENHWKQQNILGFGAGARSYLKEINTRNGYSVLHRKSAYDAYMKNVSADGFAVVDGYVMDEKEKLCKRLVLGLDGAEKTLLQAYEQECAYLLQKGYLTENNGRVFLTELGRQYRDLIAQLFFSDDVNLTIKGFSYDE